MQQLASTDTNVERLGTSVERLDTMSDTSVAPSTILAMSVDDVVRAVAESALSVEERLGFLELCEARAVEDLLADRDRVNSHRRVIATAVENGVALESDLADQIANILVRLLDDAEHWSFVQRRVLAGAVEYFIQTDDSERDFASDHGLADDARVVIAVCDALGRQDLSIDLR